MFHRAVLTTLIGLFVMVYILNLYWYKFLLRSLYRLVNGKDVIDGPNEEEPTEDSFKRVDKD